jgi:hypothetical protein
VVIQCYVGTATGSLHFLSVKYILDVSGKSAAFIFEVNPKRRTQRSVIDGAKALEHE